MAGPLTWQNVSTPNFSDVNDAARLAAGSLNNGFGGMADALGKYNQYQQDRAGSALLANAAQHTDLASLQGAMADGSLMKGVDPGYVPMDAWKAVDSHAGNLIANATSQNNLDFNKATFGSRAAQAAAQPGLTIAQTGLDNATAAHTGEETGYNYGTRDERARGLRVGNDQTVASTNQTAQNTAVAGNEFNTNQGTQELYATGVAAPDKQSAIAAIRRTPGYTADAQNRAIAAIQARPDSAWETGGGPVVPGLVTPMPGSTNTVPGMRLPVGGGTSSAIAGAVAAGSSAGESTDQLVSRVKAMAPQLTNEECVTLVRQATGMSGTVSDWRRGQNATETRLPVGTPVATFLDRNGNPSTQYDGGQGAGKSGNNTTHAGIVAGYDTDGNLQLLNQWNGSGGPRVTTYKRGAAGGGEKDANNYFAINDVNGNPMGAKNPLASGRATTAASPIVSGAPGSVPAAIAAAAGAPAASVPAMATGAPVSPVPVSPVPGPAAPAIDTGQLPDFEADRAANIQRSLLAKAALENVNRRISQNENVGIGSGILDDPINSGDLGRNLDALQGSTKITVKDPNDPTKTITTDASGHFGGGDRMWLDEAARTIRSAPGGDKLSPSDIGHIIDKDYSAYTPNSFASWFTRPGARENGGGWFPWSSAGQPVTDDVRTIADGTNMAAALSSQDAKARVSAIQGLTQLKDQLFGQYQNTYVRAQSGQSTPQEVNVARAKLNKVQDQLDAQLKLIHSSGEFDQNKKQIMNTNPYMPLISNQTTENDPNGTGAALGAAIASAANKPFGGRRDLRPMGN